MIIPINKTDYPRLIEIWESAVRATHDFLILEYFEYYKTRAPEYLAVVQLYGYKNEDGRIVGFIGIYGHKVEMLFVHNAFRGMGIGQHLLEFAIEEFNADRLYV